MGIPLFFGGYIKENHANAVVAVPTTATVGPNVNASLALDMNGIIHRTFGQQVTVYQKLPETAATLKAFEEAVFESVAAEVLRLCTIFTPHDVLIMAVDGVAPMAKMKQQRERRFRKGEAGAAFYNSNCITPGTDFMFRLDDYLHKFLVTRRRDLPPTVYYSSHMEPGEGEHKIVEIYRQGLVKNTPEHPRAGDAAGMQHLLHGLDADLILLGLLSPVENIILVRENNPEALDLQIFRRGLRRYDRPSILRDFLFITCLLGNDFLPALPAFQDIGKATRMMLQTLTRLPPSLALVNEDQSLNLRGVSIFLDYIKENESGLISAQSSLRIMLTREKTDVQYEIPPPRFAARAINPVTQAFDIDVFRNMWYSNAILGADFATPPLINYDTIIRQRLGLPPLSYGQNASPISLTLLDITTMNRNYLIMIQWVLVYYNFGTTAVNFDVLYPLYHGPLLRDLAAYSASEDARAIINAANLRAPAGQVPLTALHQLVAVLPISSGTLLPAPLQRLMTVNSPIYDLFPTTFKFDLDGKRVEHAGVSILPLISRQRIEDAVASIPLPYELVARYVPEPMAEYGLTSYEVVQLGVRYPFRIVNGTGAGATRARLATTAAAQPASMTYTHEPERLATVNDETGLNPNRFAITSATAVNWSSAVFGDPATTEPNRGGGFRGRGGSFRGAPRGDDRNGGSDRGGSFRGGARGSRGGRGGRGGRDDRDGGARDADPNAYRPRGGRR